MNKKNGQTMEHKIGSQKKITIEDHKRRSQNWMKKVNHKSGSQKRIIKVDNKSESHSGPHQWIKKLDHKI